MTPLIYVACGGAIGASARYLLGLTSLRLLGSDFPWGTFFANVIGGVLMGCLMGWLAARTSGSENIRLFAGVGLLGGFTTFSAFSLESWMMIERKAYGLFALYAGASVILSILAVALGLWLMRGASA